MIVSDAGMPVISDPGAVVARKLTEAGEKFTVCGNENKVRFPSRSARYELHLFRLQSRLRERANHLPACHKFNESEAAEKIIALSREGKNIVIVSPRASACAPPLYREESR